MNIKSKTLCIAIFAFNFLMIVSANGVEQNQEQEDFQKYQDQIIKLEYDDLSEESKMALENPPEKSITKIDESSVFPWSNSPDFEYDESGNITAIKSDFMKQMDYMKTKMKQDYAIEKGLVKYQAYEVTVRVKVNDDDSDDERLPLSEEQKVRKKNRKKKADKFKTTTMLFVVPYTAAMMVIWNQPVDKSNWDVKPEISPQAFVKGMHKNVTHRPVLDDDPFLTNYREHPLSGFLSHSVCRNLGYTWVQCLGYAAVMSLGWEYLFESVVEIPSIQDIFATPIGGTLIGEGAYQIQKYIKKHKGKLLGSKAAGKVVLCILNPMGSAYEGLNALSSKMFGKEFNLDVSTGYYKADSGGALMVTVRF